MNVSDFIKGNTRQVVTAGEETPILEAMALLLDNQISCLPVLAENKDLVGIISDKDIFKAAFKDPQGFTQTVVKDLMTTDLIVGLAGDDFNYIAGIMTNNRIRHIPIVENKRLIGLLSLGDIVKSHKTTVEVENRYLRKYIDDQYPG